MDAYKTEDEALDKLRGALDRMEVPHGEVRRRIERRAVQHDKRLSRTPSWSLPRDEELQRIVDKEMKRD